MWWVKGMDDKKCENEREETVPITSAQRLRL